MHKQDPRPGFDVSTYRAQCVLGDPLGEIGFETPQLRRYGWFQWYCRFFQGRRTEDDCRQIKRWLKICGPTGGLLENLSL